MKIRTHHSIAATAVAVALAAAPGMASAQRNASPAHIAPIAPMNLTVHMRNGIPYLNGGLVASQRAEMVNAARDFNLHLVFSARRDDRYTTGVDVVVRDAAGRRLFDLAGAGPMLWLKLPAGTYVVDTTLRGKLKKHIVTVGKMIDAQEHVLWWQGPHAS